MEQRIHIPQTLDGLRVWFKGSKVAQALLAELTEEAFEKVMEDRCRACQSVRPFPRVLVVLRRLGRFPGVEVYTEEGALVRLMEMPDVSENGALLEELIEVSLPRSWRHMMGLPAKRIHSGVFRGVSLVEALRHTERAVALKDIRATEKP